MPDPSPAVAFLPRVFPGITPEALPRLCDRFYHTDANGDDVFGGLGIGLAITRQAILQHRGKITVESVPGTGSTFTAGLPRWKP